MVFVEMYRTTREEVCFMYRHKKYTAQPHGNGVSLHVPRELTSIVPLGRQTIGRNGQWRILQFVETVETATP
jgi:hypothetical protein